MPFKSIVLAYDDEITPVKLTGSKMLPIISFEGKIMNESLDIIKLIDKNHVLSVKNPNPELDDYLNRLSKPLFSLLMPYWVFTAEFTDSSRDYFVQKKSVKRGSFEKLFKNRFVLKSEVNILLSEIEKDLSPFYQSTSFSTHDIILASHLWGLFIIPEFIFSSKMYNYLMEIKNLCDFDYHADFWKKS
jgi:glutaredoxin 2